MPHRYGYVIEECVEDTYILHLAESNEEISIYLPYYGHRLYIDRSSWIYFLNMMIQKEA